MPYCDLSVTRENDFDGIGLIETIKVVPAGSFMSYGKIMFYKWVN